MKSFACAALVALASASKKDFPKDSSFHAGCHVTAQFDGVQCSDLYALMDNEVRNWSSSTSPAGGSYSLKEEASDDYIWSTRLTLNKKYTDDQLFEFTNNSSGCTVPASPAPSLCPTLTTPSTSATSGTSSTAPAPLSPTLLARAPSPLTIPSPPAPDTEHSACLTSFTSRFMLNQTILLYST